MYVFVRQGSPGIGKTTCVLALAREILAGSVKEGVLELNASDERCPPHPPPSVVDCTGASSHLGTPPLAFERCPSGGDDWALISAACPRKPPYPGWRQTRGK